MDLVSEYAEKMNYSRGWVYRQEMNRKEETKNRQEIQFKDKIL